MFLEHLSESDFSDFSDFWAFHMLLLGDWEEDGSAAAAAIEERWREWVRISSLANRENELHHAREGARDMRGLMRAERMFEPAPHPAAIPVLPPAIPVPVPPPAIPPVPPVAHAAHFPGTSLLPGPVVGGL